MLPERSQWDYAHGGGFVKIDERRWNEVGSRGEIVNRFVESAVLPGVVELSGDGHDVRFRLLDNECYMGHTDGEWPGASYRIGNWQVTPSRE